MFFRAQLGDLEAALQQRDAALAAAAAGQRQAGDALRRAQAAAKKVLLLTLDPCIGQLKLAHNEMHAATATSCRTLLGPPRNWVLRSWHRQCKRLTSSALMLLGLMVFKRP